MLNKINLFIKWWSKQNFVCFTATYFGLSYLFVLPLIILLIFLYIFVPEVTDTLTDVVGNKITDKGLAWTLISTCIITPIRETFIYQMFIIYIVKDLKIRFQVLISALIFALVHFYDPLYILRIFPVGIVLALGYILMKKRSNATLAFLSTAIVHSLINLVAIGVSYFI